MKNDPSQVTDIFDIETNTGLLLLSELVKLNNELVSIYRPVTTIEAGFREEKSFTLPVQDAALSGKVKYSSIHPNQSHTENWIQNGDSILWTLNIHKKVHTGLRCSMDVLPRNRQPVVINNRLRSGFFQNQ